MEVPKSADLSKANQERLDGSAAGTTSSLWPPIHHS